VDADSSNSIPEESRCKLQDSDRKEKMNRSALDHKEVNHCLPSRKGVFELGLLLITPNGSKIGIKFIGTTRTFKILSAEF
jgi:hypothetical protein